LNESDEELLDRYCRGERAAFQTFFNRHSPRVLAYGISRGMSREDAMDLTQEVFIKLHRMIHHYESGRPALPWFFAIVHRTWLDMGRAKQRFSKIKDQLAYHAESFDEAPPSSQLNAAVLSGLTTKQKEVLTLRVVNDLSFREIAERTGHREATARKIFERACKFLARKHDSKDLGE